MPFTQPERYALVLAKIGAERSKLLSETKIKSLTESRNLNDLATLLRDTSYQEQISKIQSLTSRKLERAYYETLIQTYIKIIENSPKNVKQFLSLRLLRFEVEHLKALINATNAKQSAEQKNDNIYFSVEDYLGNRKVFEDATKASTIPLVVNVFKETEYYSALHTGLKSYEECGSINSFNISIDKLLYEKVYEAYNALPRKEKPHAKYYASIELDSFTLLTILRAKSLNFDTEWLRTVLPSNNFNLSSEEVERMGSAANFDNALKLILDSSYAKFFIKAETAHEIMSKAEDAFKKAILQHAKDTVIQDIFSIGAPLIFIVRKENEAHNLAVISIGIEAGMKPEEIRNQLLF